MTLTQIANETGAESILLTVPAHHFARSAHLAHPVNCMFSINVDAESNDFEPKAVLENLCDETDIAEMPLATLEQLLAADFSNYQLTVI